MKVIYVAGKYSSKSEWELIENIRLAEKAAIKLWQEGWAVLCPHKNTAFFDGVCSEDVFLEGCLEMVRRCDAIYMLGNYLDSKGSLEELKLAQELGLEIYYEN